MAAGPDTVDGSARDVGTAVERRPVPTDVLMPLDAGQVVAGMRAYQQLLKDLLDPSDWQAEDKQGRALENPFPKKSAWRKIARAFNLSFELVSRDIDYRDDGAPLRAESVVRAIAPNGQYGDGDGYCTISEFTGGRARDPKLENAMRATATTRAKNRAIADLVGLGEVSAEDLAGGYDTPTPAGSREASDELKDVVGDLISYLLDGDEDDIRRCGDRLAAQFNGALTVDAGQAIAIVGTAVRHHAER